MTFRSREDQLASSEELHSFHQPGSVLFAKPAEVDNWCHSIYPEAYPLSPPDTASDCAPSDCPDMYDPSWSQASLADESWATAPALDNSTLSQSSGHQWSMHSAAPSCPDMKSLDVSSWAQISPGSVDMGLSPVLSHESQTAHSLHLMPDQDLPLLPPGLDLSFIGESVQWNAPGSVVYAHAPQDFSASMLSSPEATPAGPHMHAFYPSSAVSQPAMYGPHQPMFTFPEGPVQVQRRAVTDPSGSPPRPLLPRMAAPVMPVNYTPGYGYTAQPQMSGTVAEGSLRVSNAHGLSNDPRSAGNSHGHGLLTPPPRPDTCSPSMIQAPSFVSGPGCEDFSTFVQYDQEDHAPVVQMSLVQGGVPCPTHLSAHHQDLTPTVSRADSDGSITRKATSTTGSMTGEADEGRHRNHPLYSKGPEADGLYHCPFTTSDPNCGHKPTKLKCNYDKFIDSHLKPFRCKVDSCSKQEFSSTACLLRHEREAHGMHGHGERPHLCLYPGCERGIPGNGFPRRYNLFDHMKRVHDHKEEPQQDRAADQGARKPASRKRKTSPASEERVSQRQKTQSASTPAMSTPREGYPLQMPVYPEQQMFRRDQDVQRNMYSQWNHQKQLVEFQMNSLSSPDDQVNLERLSQNVEELRRLSHQARHG